MCIIAAAFVGLIRSIKFAAHTHTQLSNRRVISHTQTQQNIAPPPFNPGQILNCNTLSCISFSNESVNLSVNWQQKNGEQNTHISTGAKVFPDLLFFSVLVFFLYVAAHFDFDVGAFPFSAFE